MQEHSNLSECEVVMRMVGNIFYTSVESWGDLVVAGLPDWVIQAGLPAGKARPSWKKGGELIRELVRQILHYSKESENSQP